MAKHKTDLAATHSDVTSRNVSVGSNVTLEFGHEALAEPHHFVVTLPLGIKIRPAFSTAHGQRGKRVLEYLFECQELQDAQIHGSMEAQAALVRTNCAVHLDAKTAIHQDISLIIKPRHAEHDHTLRFHNPLQQTGRLVFRMLRQHQPQRFEHFLHGLMEFRLRGILRFHTDHYFFHVFPGSRNSGRRHSARTHIPTLHSYKRSSSNSSFSAPLAVTAVILLTDLSEFDISRHSVCVGQSPLVGIHPEAVRFKVFGD